MSAPRRPALDWERAHRRLREGWAATEAALSPGGARAQAILGDRAAKLARPAPVEPLAETAAWMTFALGRGLWAIEVRWVRAVAPLCHVAGVPGGPAWLVGVVDLRGEVVPVADIRAHLGVSCEDDAQQTTLIVLGGGSSGALRRRESDAPLGIVTGDADAIIRLFAHEILDRPELVSGERRAWVRGVTKDALVLLDAEALLEDPGLTMEPLGQ